MLQAPRHVYPALGVGEDNRSLALAKIAEGSLRGKIGEKNNKSSSNATRERFSGSSYAKQSSRGLKVIFQPMSAVPSPRVLLWS